MFDMVTKARNQMTLFEKYPDLEQKYYELRKLFKERNLIGKIEIS